MIIRFVSVIKAVSYGGLFFSEVTSKSFFCFQVSYCPVKRKSSRLFSKWVWLLSERYPDQFSASRESQLREFRTSSFFNCVVRKLTVDQNGGSVLVNFCFLARKLKNELVRNSRNCDNREAGKWPGYLSASSQTHSEKSRLDSLSLRGI